MQYSDHSYVIHKCGVKVSRWWAHRWDKLNTGKYFSNDGSFNKLLKQYAVVELPNLC
jgi:hypothetical protein